jgi:Cu-Zn family superoxide dismutase
MIKATSLWSSTVALCAALGMACDRQDKAPVSEEPTDETRGAARAQPSILAPAPTGVPAPTGIGPEAPGAADKQDARAEANEKAKVELKAAEGEEIEGEAEFHATTNGVHIVAEIEDAKPGKHGIHIHEKGDCSDIKGKSMGAHFAPKKQPHALPAEGTERHVGDLGNIEVDKDGNGRLEITVTNATLERDGEMSILGKALVVHLGEDSGKAEQPSGDSGVPIACGVIEKT